MARTDDLDDLFAAERDVPVVPSDGLLARIEADAMRLQPRPAVRVSPPPRGLWGVMSAIFGGGGALAGMGTATVAGLYLGLAQPASISNLTEALLTGATLESVDLMPSFDTLLIEE